MRTLKAIAALITAAIRSPPVLAVYEEYAVPPGQYSFSLLFKPLDAAAASGENSGPSLAERANAEWRAQL